MTPTRTLSRTQLTESMIRVVLPPQRTKPRSKRPMILAALFGIALIAWAVAVSGASSTPTVIPPLFW